MTSLLLPNDLWPQILRCLEPTDLENVRFACKSWAKEAEIIGRERCGANVILAMGRSFTPCGDRWDIWNPHGDLVDMKPFLAAFAAQPLRNVWAWGADKAGFTSQDILRRFFALAGIDPDVYLVYGTQGGDPSYWRYAWFTPSRDVWFRAAHNIAAIDDASAHYIGCSGNRETLEKLKAFFMDPKNECEYEEVCWDGNDYLGRRCLWFRVGGTVFHILLPLPSAHLCLLSLRLSLKAIVSSMLAGHSENRLQPLSIPVPFHEIRAGERCLTPRG